MDQSFRDEMTAGYALTEPAVVIGSPMLEGEVDNDARVQVALSMLNRHGLIAGRHRHRQDEDAAAARGPAVEGRGAGLHQRHQGRRVGHGRAGRRDQPEGPGAGGVAELDVPAERPPRRVPVAVGQAGRPGPGDGPLLRAAAPRQGPRPERDPDLDPRPRLQVLRRQQPAAARPRRPRDDAQVPVVGRGQADPRGLRRDVGGLGRRAPALDHRPPAGRASTRSSASPSSRSSTCSGRRRTARASSASSSCPT